MTDRDEKSAVSAFYDLIADEYGRQYDRETFDTLDKYPQNYFRLQLLVRELAQAGVHRVYEVGTGDGTPLAMMARMGFEVAGCDISRNMVSSSIEKLRAAGIESPDIQWADVEDILTMANQIREPYDAAFAFGVLPHVSNAETMLANMRSIVGGDGRVFVEFRNKLFALTTFNRLTYDFIVEDLLAPVSEDVKRATAETVRSHVAMDLPEGGHSGKTDYNKIKADFHNPFELLELFERCGFKDARIHWYHYHPGLPRLEAELGARWREEAMKLEGESSGWRGLFLCSAGVVEARVG